MNAEEFTGGRFTILHISSLHINNDRDFNRTTVFDPFFDRLVLDAYNNNLKPDAAVVSGDIAWQGSAGDYEQAKQFFERLLSVLDLDAGRLFMVPGNHDVNRAAYRPSDVPSYNNMDELNKELENENYRMDLFKGLADYFSYIKSDFPHLVQVGGCVPFIRSLKTSLSGKVVLAGLNSAWMCRKSPDKGQPAIGEYQLKKAFEAVKQEKDARVIINIFHHPLEWLWSRDRKICCTYFHNTVCLVGHTADAEGRLLVDYESKIYQFEAGGMSPGPERKRIPRYHYITFDEKTNTLCLDFRTFNKRSRRWVVDGEKGDDGKKVYEDFFVKQEKPVSITDTIDIQLKQGAVFDKYMEAAYHEHQHLPTKGFETSLLLPIPIKDIYVRMRAFLHAAHTRKGLKHDTISEPETGEMSPANLDMMKAFTLIRQRNIRDMVILGDPGSGKTTLLKYITIMLIEGKGEETLGMSSRLIPFYAPLRELDDPAGENFCSFIAGICCFDELEIPVKEFKTLLHKGGAIILLDGLDEVAEKSRRLSVIRWIEKAMNVYCNTHFIITSRLAGYTGNYRLDGNLVELVIDDFTPEEVKAFLVNWYRTVEGFLHGNDEHAVKKGEAEAKKLYAQIMVSDRLKRFVKNPLLLQITAQVHRARGHLPERRVELFEESTNILLEKWDMAKGLDVPIQAREARKLLQPVALWLHQKDERRSAPLEEIIKVIEKPLGEIGKSRLNAEELLRNIRDRSGIFMGYSHDEYGFIHLSFQEYLAAEEIRNRNMISLLVDNYENRWWREVILLCLGLDNPSIIGSFIEKIIRAKVFIKEITLVQDALRDSREKPVDVLDRGLDDPGITGTAKRSILLLLAGLADQGVALARKVIEGAVKNKDRQVALAAASILKGNTRIEVVHAAEETGMKAEIVHEKDGAEMVLIPAGPFLYGSKEDDKEARQREKPQRVVELPAFYMDKYLVTNERYCRFLNEEQPDGEKLGRWIYLTGSFENEKCRIGKKGKVYYVEKGFEQYPVIYVSWYGAGAYAKWAGKKLPGEEEWEKAARGTDGRKYPWGEEWEKERCNSRESRIWMTTPVDKYPAGVSEFGCFDMAGNVWEWTKSEYEGVKGYFVLRGGSWCNVPDYCRCAFRNYAPHLFIRNLYAGFRCARA